jgi:hypothetical protein
MMMMMMMMMMVVVVVRKPFRVLTRVGFDSVSIDTRVQYCNPSNVLKYKLKERKRPEGPREVDGSIWNI